MNQHMVQVNCRPVVAALYPWKFAQQFQPGPAVDVEGPSPACSIVVCPSYRHHLPFAAKQGQRHQGSCVKCAPFASNDHSKDRGQCRGSKCLWYPPAYGGSQ